MPGKVTDYEILFSTGLVWITELLSVSRKQKVICTQYIHTHVNRLPISKRLALKCETLQWWLLRSPCERPCLIQDSSSIRLPSPSMMVYPQRCVKTLLLYNLPNGLRALVTKSWPSSCASPSFPFRLFCPLSNCVPVSPLPCPPNLLLLSTVFLRLPPAS